MVADGRQPGAAVSFPLISIVIPCFNAAATIRESIESVLSQDYQPLEVIIQDGGSSDDTIEILREYGDRLNIVSEPDSGQADALKKGILRAHGTIVGWLNADDIYAPGALTHIARVFQRQPDMDIVYGDFQLINEHGAVLRRINLSDWEWEKLITRATIPFSGATFFHRRVFQRYGMFDESLHYAMDLEYFLRVGRTAHAHHVPAVLASFRVHQASKTGSVPLKFVKEGHRLRWSYSGDSWRLRLGTIKLDLLGVIYSSLNGLRWSKASEIVRRSKRG